MLLSPVPTTPASITNVVTKQQLIQFVQKQVQQVMQQVIGGMPSFGSMSVSGRKYNSVKVQSALAAMLQSMAAQGQIDNFIVGDVTMGGHEPFYEVNTLAPGVVPGDPYTTFDEESEEQYHGLVLACDGEGWGLILGERLESTGAVRATITVQPQFIPEYVSISIKQEQ